MSRSVTVPAFSAAWTSDMSHAHGRRKIMFDESKFAEIALIAGWLVTS